MENIDITPDDIFRYYNGFIPEDASELLHDANVRMLDKLLLEGKRVFLINSNSSNEKVFEYTGQRLYNFCCNFYTVNKELMDNIPNDVYEFLAWLDEHKEVKPIFWS